MTLMGMITLVQVECSWREGFPVQSVCIDILRLDHQFHLDNFFCYPTGCKYTQNIIYQSDSVMVTCIHGIKY